jgi:putative peptide zinc metalloprotease protein
VFIADHGEPAPVRCRLGAIDRLNLAVLEQPLLASVYGGPIPAEQRERGLIPLAATFRVRLDACDLGPAPLREVSGVARIAAQRHSLLGDGWRRLVTVIHREAGL